MNRKLMLLAALLLAGASTAALAQEHDHDRGDRPQAQGQGGGGGHGSGGEHHGAPAAAPQASPAPRAAPALQGASGGGDHHWNGGDRARFQGPPPQAGAASPQPAPGRWSGERNGFQPQPQNGPALAAPGPRGGDPRLGQRNGFAPGASDGDRHWDRRDAPREVIPPGQNADRGWDRDHDGHGAGRQAWDRRYDERGVDRWANDHRSPPANWQHWQRGRYPPIYAASHRFRIGPYRAPYGWYVRSWAFGDVLPRGWFAPDYWVDDFWDYDLPYPPPGFHWVRVGDDALLVDDYSGRIMQVVRDIFW
jgi:Ni/Co efflux regulator RcnB